MGKFCETPICYPPCLNAGRCVAPGVCECVGGFIGNVCEGGEYSIAEDSKLGECD